MWKKLCEKIIKVGQEGTMEKSHETLINHQEFYNLM